MKIEGTSSCTQMLFIGENLSTEIFAQLGNTKITVIMIFAGIYLYTPRDFYDILFYIQQIRNMQNNDIWHGLR